MLEVSIIGIQHVLTVIRKMDQTRVIVSLQSQGAVPRSRNHPSQVIVLIVIPEVVVSVFVEQQANVIVAFT